MRPLICQSPETGPRRRRAKRWASTHRPSYEHHDESMSFSISSWCAAGACARAHASANVLHEAQIIGRKVGTAERISAAATRVSAQLSRASAPDCLRSLVIWRPGERPHSRPSSLRSTCQSIVQGCCRSLNRTPFRLSSKPTDRDAGIYSIAAAEMSCSSKSCSQTHEATARLAALHASLSAHGRITPSLAWPNGSRQRDQRSGATSRGTG